MCCYVPQKKFRIYYTQIFSINQLQPVLYLVLPRSMILWKERKKERHGRNQLLCQGFLEVRNKSTARFNVSNLISTQCGLFPLLHCWVHLPGFFSQSNTPIRASLSQHSSTGLFQWSIEKGQWFIYKAAMQHCKN